MYIFVDESGSFTQASELNAWCVVTAYVAPEYQRRHIDVLMEKVRALNGGVETKLKNLTEDQYIWFLRELNKLQGVAFAVAVDVGLHRREMIEHHRNMQAEKVVEHRETMLYEGGRQAVTNLSQQIKSLPPQLYTQLVCQVFLFHRVITQGTLYFVQRHPPSLANFGWRLDQKARVQTAYEKAFRTVLPMILQTESLTDPMLMLKGADYRHFKRFDYSPGQAPTYLKDLHGIDYGEGSNIGRIIHEDFRLVDSASTPGVQVADLLASGMRRLFRGGFKAEAEVAFHLGANFIEPWRGAHTVRLVSLDQKAPVDARVAHFIHQMDAAARQMLTG